MHALVSKPNAEVTQQKFTRSYKAMHSIEDDTHLFDVTFTHDECDCGMIQNDAVLTTLCSMAMQMYAVRKMLHMAQMAHATPGLLSPRSMLEVMLPHIAACAQRPQHSSMNMAVASVPNLVTSLHQLVPQCTMHRHDIMQYCRHKTNTPLNKTNQLAFEPKLRNKVSIPCTDTYLEQPRIRPCSAGKLIPESTNRNTGSLVIKLVLRSASWAPNHSQSCHMAQRPQETTDVYK